MLEGTPYQDFGRWIKARRQRGFREFDTLHEVGAYGIMHRGGGSLDPHELREAVMAYFRSMEAGFSCAEVMGPESAALAIARGLSHQV